MKGNKTFRSIVSLLLGLGILIIILSLINPTLINANWIVISNAFIGLLPYLIGIGLVALWVSRK